MKQNLEELGLEGLTGTFIGATDEYIANTERQISFRLPDDYRDFLKRYGASLFNEDFGFRPKEPSPWASGGIETIDIFYGMSARSASDLLQVNVRLRNVIGDRSIAIGHDPGSNLVLLDDSGAVFFFDRETGRRFLAAPNFQEFLDSFEPQHST